MYPSICVFILTFFASSIFLVYNLGVPSQPSNFRAIDIGETAVTLQWSRPSHSGDTIVHFELYYNDTYANEQHHQYDIKNLIYK
jgi:hypothetical protein